ncbi:MAG: DUF1211 domain-containing protein [Caldilineaceae bacterium]|nr:DUF1211 domain-containing protein [Caldilineaceae bacterium]
MFAARTKSPIANELGLERIVFFSDAVIAIAITLLAIEIRLPTLPEGAPLASALWALWPRYLSFAISFIVIGTYWIAHHNMFEYIDRYTSTLLWLNLLFLLCIAFAPFPTAVVGEYGTTAGAQIFYAASVVVTGAVKLILWAYAARGRRLLEEETTRAQIRAVTVRGVITPLVFLISIPFAFVHYSLPIVIWCATGLVYPAVRLIWHD